MKLGIIGGSGLYEIKGVEKVRPVKLKTPFGKPSDELVAGEFGGVDMVFLPRHGRGHRILPGEINYRANIFAMKEMGVTHIASISAVGSLKEDFRPKDVVIVSQYFDRTKRQDEQTFFGNGIVAHVSLAEPVCHELNRLVHAAATEAVHELDVPETEKPSIHLGGTYLNMEGPTFSTKAESNVYRSWGMDIIGMTNLSEARLAREAEICYSSIAMVTDYDCWHPDHDHVTVDMIVKNFTSNVALAKAIIMKLVPLMKGASEACRCRSALASAIITNPDLVDRKMRKSLAPIIGKYLPVGKKGNKK